MKKFSRARRALVFAAVVTLPALSGALFPPAKVSSKAAYPMYAKEIIYYSDSSYTHEVGVGYIYCNGTSTLDGTSTRYRRETIIDVCCGDPGGNGGVPC